LSYVALCVALAVAVVASLAFDFSGAQVHARSEGFHIVIDAGHGGRDGGASSRSGTLERDINLAIAKHLKAEFEHRGAGVTLTRANEHSLASPYAKNQKRSDMDERRKIIEQVKPDLVISIHLNSFPSNPAVRGLQTFFDKTGEKSKEYAQAIQENFNKSSLNINRRATVGDYYILECTAFPSVLVECGFLSNPSEEKLLKTTAYQKMLAQLIASAVI
jgi:N-acetylmuramoyl-L-alanine amidase